MQKSSNNNTVETAQHIFFLSILLLIIVVVAYILISAYFDYRFNNAIITDKISESINELRDKGNLTEKHLVSLSNFKTSIYFNSNTISFFFNVLAVCFTVLGGSLLIRDKALQDRIRKKQEILNEKLLIEQKKIETQNKAFLAFSQIELDISIITNKIFSYHTLNFSSGKKLKRDMLQKMDVMIEIRESLNSLYSKLVTQIKEKSIFSQEHWEIINKQILILDTIKEELDGADTIIVNKCKELINLNLSEN